MVDIKDFSEIEIKLDAALVDENAFVKWAKSKRPSKYEFVCGPDYYFAHRNGEVIRYRQSESKDFSQITIKKRRNKKSIKDRLEVNITIDPSSNTKDVFKFFELLGYKTEFWIFKKSHIFTFRVKTQKGAFSHITVVLYTVYQINSNEEPVSPPSRFIEIEAEGRNINKPEALEIISDWQNQIQEKFSLKKKPLNKSLYEIFSGKTYSMEGKVR